MELGVCCRSCMWTFIYDQVNLSTVNDALTSMNAFKKKCRTHKKQEWFSISVLFSWIFFFLNGSDELHHTDQKQILIAILFPRTFFPSIILIYRQFKAEVVCDLLVLRCAVQCNVLFWFSSGNALARVQRVHEPKDLWDITFCTRWFWGF